MVPVEDELLPRYLLAPCVDQSHDGLKMAFRRGHLVRIDVGPLEESEEELAGRGGVTI